MAEWSNVGIEAVFLALAGLTVQEKPSCVFVKGVTIGPDGKDTWVFNIDETLLSNFPYYQAYGFRSETFDEASFDGWAELAEAPVLPASLNLYSQLERLGFKIFC
ncbi:acid phosphatase 1-like [Malus sylvestris]|uniref:acid phosphatase 1-like n=1 Tax=Malus sylvestris TaxID=3752 RepID=UPI0021ACA9C5|nr:acid phosphatase 1-like [Malus sylvestris]